MTSQITKEALLTGVVVTVIGLLIHVIGMYIKHHDMNDNVVLGLHFFITGVITYLSYEYLGVHKWYCVHGNACKKIN